MPVELGDERTERTAWVSELQVPVAAIKLFEENRRAFPNMPPERKR
jgi:hypothetical protein